MYNNTKQLFYSWLSILLIVTVNMDMGSRVILCDKSLRKPNKFVQIELVLKKWESQIANVLYCLRSLEI